MDSVRQHSSRRVAFVLILVNRCRHSRCAGCAGAIPASLDHRQVRAGTGSIKGMCRAHSNGLPARLPGLPPWFPLPNRRRPHLEMLSIDVVYNAPMREPARNLASSASRIRKISH